MRTNISYTDCYCDICGKNERIPMSRNLPDGWGRVSIERHAIKDVCEDCLKEIEKTIENLETARKGDVK